MSNKKTKLILIFTCLIPIIYLCLIPITLIIAIIIEWASIPLFVSIIFILFCVMIEPFTISLLISVLQYMKDSGGKNE